MNKASSRTEKFLDWRRDNRLWTALVLLWFAPTALGFLGIMFLGTWFVLANISMSEFTNQHTVVFWWMIHSWIILGSSGSMVVSWIHIHDWGRIYEKHFFKWVFFWGFATLLTLKLLLWALGVY